MKSLTTPVLGACLLVSMATFTWQLFHYAQVQAEVSLDTGMLSALSSKVAQHATTINELSAQVEGLRTEQVTITEQTRLAGEALAEENTGPHPDFPPLWEEAVAEARQELEALRAEALRSERTALQRRLANADYELRSSLLWVEADYGAALRNLGIGEERYLEIIQALAARQFDYQNHRASYAAGTLSQQDYNALMESTGVRDELRRQLNDAEVEAIETALEQPRRGVAEYHMRVLNAVRHMAPETRELIANVYFDAEAQLRPQYSSHSPNSYRNRADFHIDHVIPATREMLANVLNAEEMAGLELYLEHMAADSEARALRAEAQMKASP